MRLNYMVVDRNSEEQPAGLRSHYEVLQPKLRRLLTARLGSSADAEDLMQDLWIKLSQNPPGPIANPSAYLHKMALNLANDLVRSRMRQRGREAAYSDVMIAEPNSVAIDPSPSPEAVLTANMQLDVLLRAIRALPERAQQVFRRHRIDGASHAEVAAEFGITKSAVEKNMATAMRHLVRAMHKDEQA